MIDLFRGVGVEITLPNPDCFLKIKETLTRIGIPSNRTNHLYQSCHILHKQGQYAIVHFKELFELDGKATNFSEEDEARRNTIVSLLAEWGLLEITNSADMEIENAPLNQMKIVSYKDKANWTLVAKYQIGRKK